MNEERMHVVEMALQWEHPEYRKVLETLVDLEGGEWYIREKIVKAPDAERRRDNGRVLKYAYNFFLNGAEIKFVRERKHQQTPDLAVVVKGTMFYVEVRKFRIDVATHHEVAKISGEIKDKATQLPADSIGFVAIDNFSLNLESVGRDMTYEHIFAALEECERAGAENPEGWRRPSGVVIHAHTSGGAFSGPVSIPHFVWTNRYADPAAPAWLTQWIANSLPDGQIIDARAAATPLEPTARTEDQ